LDAVWSGFDPEVRRQLDGIRRQVARRHETPTKEWPLTLVEEHNLLLVVREWPGGEVTAYLASTLS
jgi:hypothetical protein